MSNQISYERAVPHSRPQWWPGAVAIATLLVVMACVAWSRATPALGERALPGVKVWMARCAAASLWMAAQALLMGVALPALYQPRAAYAGLTAFTGLMAVLAGVSAAALWLAT
jgi:hypothetical protein